MRITTKSKIAVAALLDIAVHTANEYAIALPVVSKRLGISRSYLEPIFSSLKAAGLIHSHRGPGGGYFLAKIPAAISVKDIVDATGHPQPLTEDLGAQLWANLDAHMQNQMAQITLNHILANIAVGNEPKHEKRQKTKKSQAPTVMLLKKIRKSLGPNSVFSFGKYVLQK
jgi:Rrf2 family iron-sulfur cluster assembly transcriptional regulator